MTVAELIAKLQTMPPDADVIYRACSDWELLEDREVELQTAEESREEVERCPPNVWPSFAVCYRGGRYCNAYPLSAYPPDEKPEYRTVVTLPGN